MELASGSIVIVDLSVKLSTMKYKELAPEPLFNAVHTDGNFVTWDEAGLTVTAKELVEIALFGCESGSVL